MQLLPMLRRIAAPIVIGALFFAPSAKAAVTPAIPAGYATGFNNPETMVWDARTGAWYVSNNALSGGAPSIAKLLPGQTSPTIFATGADLSGAQGVVISGHSMYVAAGANVVVINMDDVSQRTLYNVGNAGDLDVDPVTGDIYVGSFSNNVIKVIHDGTVSTFASAPAPDGVYFYNGGVFYNTLGFANANSGLFRIDVATKALTQLAKVPFGVFDGLERDGNSWLMTDFGHGELIRVLPDGSINLLAELAPGSAQLGFDPATRTVFVPNLVTGLCLAFTV